MLKALAIGAHFVFLGLLYAAAVGGEAGVRHAAQLLAQEIDRDMALLGVNALSELSPELLRRLASAILRGEMLNDVRTGFFPLEPASMCRCFLQHEIIRPTLGLVRSGWRSVEQGDALYPSGVSERKFCKNRR